MDSNEFLNLIEMLPKWATDDTLMSIVRMEGRSLQSHMGEVNRIAKKLGMKQVQVNIEDFIGQKKRTQTRIDRFLNGVQKEVNSIGGARAVDPIRGFGEIAEIGGRAMAGAGEAVSDFGKLFVNKYATGARVAGTTAQYAGKGIAGMAAFSGALAPIIMAQEKNLRAMLEYGMMFDRGLPGATEMRGAAANMGMSVSEMLKGLDGMRHVFVNGEGSLADNSLYFNNFVGNLASASRNDQGFNQFGLVGTQFIKEMGNVTKMFFEQGEMSELNIPTRRRITKTFEDTQKIALAMAEMTGINREQLINSGLDAQGRDEMKGNLLRNKAILEEKYGEGVTVQMQLNADFLNGLFKEMLPDLADGMDQTLTGFVRMLPTTDNVLMSVPQEINEILALGGTEVTKSYVSLVESLKDGSNRVEVANRFKEFVRLAREIPNAPAVGDATLDSVLRLKNAAEVIPDAFVESTSDAIQKRVDLADAKTEEADNSVEAVEATKVGMRMLQHKIVPGYENLGGIFASTTDELARFKKFLVEAGVIKPPNVTSASEELAKMNEYRVAPGTKEGQEIIASEGGYGGVFDPYTGVTISDDQVVSDRLGTGSKTTLTGPAPSRDPTIEMAPAEVPPVRPGDRVHQIQNKTAAIRKGPLAEALVTILKNAAIVTDPNLRVEVTSGGQMPLDEWKASTKNKDRKGKKYFLDGQAVRTGSERHDGGMSADLQLRLGDHLIPYTHPKFLQFTEAFFALGGRAGSADHDYMGKHRGHFDIVGTDKGGSTRWNASAGFAQAQDSGLIMATRPEANPYLKRLQEIQAAQDEKITKKETTIQTANVTDSNQSLNTSNNSVTPDDTSKTRMDEINKTIAAEQSRIDRSNSGVNEYFGRETKGREKSSAIIEKLKKELAEMVAITQQNRTNTILEAN